MRKAKTTILILCLTVFQLMAYAQNYCNCDQTAKVDSLFKLIDGEKKSKVSEHINSFPASVNANCKTLLEIAKTWYYVVTDSLSQAEASLQGIQRLVESNPCSLASAHFHHVYGLYYVKRHMSDSALHHFLLSREIAHELDERTLEAKTLGRIAYVFSVELNDPNKALEYDNEALLLLSPEKETELYLLIKFNKLACFGRMFDLTGNIGLIDSIVNSANEALSLAKKTNNVRRVGQAYSLLAGASLTLKKYEAGIMYCDSALALLNRATDFQNFYTILLKKSDILLLMGNVAEARSCADSALYFATQTQNRIFVSHVYERFFEIDSLQGDYKSAFRYLMLYHAINDSVNKVERLKTTTELEKQYSQLKNEEQIRELNHKNEIASLKTNVLIVGIILLIITGFIMYRQIAVRNRLRIAEAEQRLNRSRMNPHLLFNTLNSLQTSALKDRDPDRLADLLAMYARIMRKTLESSYEDLVSIEEEIQYIEMYLKLQQFRKSDSFTYSVSVDEEIEIDLLQIPSMIIQPFAENSIEHGFRNENNAHHLSIHIKPSGKMLQVLISDNGEGFMSESVYEKEYKSRASEITRDRLYLLNTKLKTKAGYTVAKNDNGKGTIVTILLPILTKK